MMANGFCMFIMVFKHMTFSKQLRFIFDLFDATAGDLAYFFLVFVTFLVAFSMTAFIIFGSDLMDYRTIQWSILNLVIASVTELDYDSMFRSNRTVAAWFYTLWVFAMMMILINVFIAILLDAYTELRTQREKNAEDLKAAGKDEAPEGFTLIKQQITNRFLRGSNKISKVWDYCRGTRPAQKADSKQSTDEEEPKGTTEMQSVRTGDL